VAARWFKAELDRIKLFEVYLAVAIETAYSSATSSAILPLFPCPFFSAVVGWGKHLTETFEPFLVANCEVFSFLCAPQWSCYMRDGLVVNPCPTRTLTNPPRIVHAVIFQPQVEFANADAYTVSLPHFSGG